MGTPVLLVLGNSLSGGEQSFSFTPYRARKSFLLSSGQKITKYVNALIARIRALIPLLISKVFDEVFIFFPRYKSDEDYWASMENTMQLWKKRDNGPENHS